MEAPGKVRGPGAAVNILAEPGAGAQCGGGARRPRMRSAKSMIHIAFISIKISKTCAGLHSSRIRETLCIPKVIAESNFSMFLT
jgi:hypothetical protein